MLLLHLFRTKAPATEIQWLTAQCSTCVLRSVFNLGMGLVVRTIGIARATIKIGMANLVYNFQRLAWLQGRTAPA